MSPDQQTKFRRREPQQPQVIQSRTGKFTRLASIPPSKPRHRLTKPVRLTPNQLAVDRWEKHLERSKSWRIHITHELLHSRAYRQLNYGPALKVLTWFFEKIRVDRIKGKRGSRRYQIRDEDISFTYWEAELRGLTHQKFCRAIKELHRLGFIDIVKPGSGLRGDWTQFRMSERWRDFETANFKCIQFPRSVYQVNFGFGGKSRGS